MKPDRETQKELDKGEMMSNFVGSAGWQEAKSLLIKRLADINDIRAIDNKDSSLAFQELAARQMVMNTIIGWIGDLEGIRETHLHNKEVMLEVQHEFIDNLEGGENSE